MRDFKSELTTEYIKPLAEMGMMEELKFPPKRYSDIIDEREWLKFVTSRLSPEFQIVHQEQKACELQMMSRHRTSRRGMTYIRENLVSIIDIKV